MLIRTFYIAFLLLLVRLVLFYRTIEGIGRPFPLKFDKMKRTLTLLLSLGYITANGQYKYRIETDYLQEKTTYLKLDKFNQVIDTLEKPRFKKHAVVQVKVKNVNPFAVNVESSLKETVLYKNEQGFNFAKLLAGTAAFAGKKLAINVEDFSSAGKILSDTRGNSTANRLSDFNKLSTEVTAIRETLAADLSNPHLSKTAIKENLVKLARLPEDARLTSPEENFYLYIASLERVFQADKLAITGEVNAMVSGIDSLKPGSRGDGSEVVILRNLKNLLAGLDESAAVSIDNLQKIKILYGLLENSVFERTFEYVLDADQADLELKFSPSTLLPEGLSSVPNSSMKIKLSSSGGFKINTSIAFTLHKADSQNFYIDDNQVVRGDAYDEFVPGLGTMLNFYPVLSNNYNVGGSFGISIPLRSEIKGLNFLLGPSVILGNENRLVISGGLAYSPVNKLTNGIELNAPTRLTSLNNFITSVYKPGVYFSISFNIMKFN